jgi:replicative DNA helicase
MVDGDDYYQEAHRRVFRAMLDLYLVDEPADLVMLTEELRRRGELDGVGSVSYVSSLGNQVPTSANTAYYALHPLTTCR